MKIVYQLHYRGDVCHVDRYVAEYIACKIFVQSCGKGEIEAPCLD